MRARIKRQKMKRPGRRISLEGHSTIPRLMFIGHLPVLRLEAPLSGAKLGLKV